MLGYADSMSRSTDDPQTRKLTALTIAGYDPGSGAGVTADLLTFARFGLFATSAITALTVQSTRGVRRVEPVEPDLLRSTLEELEADLPADGVKIGMLGGAAQVQAVAAWLQQVRLRRQVTVVLDPVLVSSSGSVLLDAPGRAALQKELLPFVDAVTPNAQEASLLTGLPCATQDEAQRCAQQLATRYPNLIPIVTGGHLEPPSDLVWLEGRPAWIGGQRLQSRATHGTGCAFSSALLADYLSSGDWTGAAAVAKHFVTGAIRSATPRGGGHGPLNLITTPAREADSANH